MSSFEEWWNGPDRTPKGTMYEYEVCRDTWNARQPEMDALTSRLQRAERVIEAARRSRHDVGAWRHRSGDKGDGLLERCPICQAIAAYDKEENPV